MAIGTQVILDGRGLDEVVSNQRSRAYVAGNPVAASIGGSGSFGTLWMTGTGVPTSLAAGTPITITAAQLGGGIIVQTPTAATTFNLDTATNIQTYMNNNSAGIAIGDILVCTIINANATAANTITVAVGTGGSLDGNQAAIIIQANQSRTLMIRITAVGASPTYTVYG